MCLDLVIPLEFDMLSMQTPWMASMIYVWESGSFDRGVLRRGWLGSCWMMHGGDGVGQGCVQRGLHFVVRG